VGATQLSHNPVHHSRMKHIVIDLYFVRDYVTKGLLQVHHVSSHDRLTDLLTKALPRIRFTHLRTKISITDGEPILRGCVKNPTIDHAPSVTTVPSTRENQAVKNPTTNHDISPSVTTISSARDNQAIIANLSESWNYGNQTIIINMSKS
jgi:hypothetical protein